ncbi:hypothetical protein N8I77_007356 [Diaporthe amygdali]|uniref:Uncharacterized protein n=1 Tax=Phomopsis amygdali TaxID=1214568 RepID=A0AAD9SCV4_PHOAM|nr:hypothetical protein N8I77_007356 [Diaporthe amygdali]
MQCGLFRSLSQVVGGGCGTPSDPGWSGLLYTCADCSDSSICPEFSYRSKSGRTLRCFQGYESLAYLSHVLRSGLPSRWFFVTGNVNLISSRRYVVVRLESLVCSLAPFSSGCLTQQHVGLEFSSIPLPRGPASTLIPHLHTDFRERVQRIKGDDSREQWHREGGCPSQWDDSTPGEGSVRRKEAGSRHCPMSFVHCGYSRGILAAQRPMDHHRRPMHGPELHCSQ